MGLLTIPRVELDIELYISSFVAMRKAYIGSGEEDMMDNTLSSRFAGALPHHAEDKE